ncbi:hypothetical protein Pelo_551 [Pelomyxa schiedti]|nr:hypothetical protein Pelo_551 [Pelomyxa schiedti]
MALACQNDSISKWLEQRYIATAGTRPKFSLAELMETSEENSTNRHEDWLDWLFGHSSLCDIDHSEPELAEFMDQVSQSNSQFQVDVAVSAWKKFPSLSPITHHERMLDLFHSVLFYGNKVQEFASFGELTRSELQQCMDYYYPYSSKVGKWLVRECCFSDPHAEVTVKNFPSSCGLFFASIQVNKRGFVKWLFNTFHFTFDEVLSELKTRELGNDVDLATWKLLMRLFPSEITRDVLITHPNLMMVATATPLHAEFTLKRVPGVTIDDIKQCSSDHALRWMRPTVSHRQMIDIWAGGQWS